MAMSPNKMRLISNSSLKLGMNPSQLPKAKTVCWFCSMMLNVAGALLYKAMESAWRSMER